MVSGLAVRSHVQWPKTYRIIRSIYPPVDLFEDIADPRDWEALVAVEAKTNPRFRFEVGDLGKIPANRRVSGVGASYVMAPFVHCSTGRPSRFTDGSYGIYYAGDSEEVAVAETIHHHQKFMSSTPQPPGWTSDFRVLVSSVDRTLDDVNAVPDVLHPHDYTAYADAARNAIQAGMDGVEIHAGNGYLIDQFINSASNHRTDNYGGSVENRARFLLEVVDCVAAAVGADRVGVRLTPMGRFMGMSDDTPEATFGYIAEELVRRGLTYLHLVEPEIVGTVRDEHYNPRWDAIIHQLRESYRGLLILAGGYDYDKAQKAIAEGRADIIAFGRLFIANPDLPGRFRSGAPLNAPDSASFFGGDERGYLDYPALTQPTEAPAA